MRVGAPTLILRAVILSGVTLLVIFITPDSSNWQHQNPPVTVSLHRQSTLSLNRFDRRQQVLDEYCSAANLTRVPNPSTLLYSKTLNVIYCPVLEAASFETKYSMLKSEGQQLLHQLKYGISKSQAIHTQAQRLNLNPRALKNPSKLNPRQHSMVIIVRDPWLRLSAAYSDLVVKKNYYRHQCRNFDAGSKVPMSFDGFLNCILLYTNETANTNKLNSRLLPMTLTCSTCKTRYSTVAKFETLEDDLADFSRNTTGKVKLLDNLNVTAIQESRMKDAEDFRLRMSSLPRVTIDRIQLLYRSDFKAFGYDLY